MKVYIAGPMRGKPDFNFPAFHAAAASFRADGHEVFNPAEADLSEFNTVENVQAFYEHDKEYMKRHVMRKDLLWILDHAEAIAMLPGWMNSPGANAELALAKYLNLKEIYL